MTDSRPTPSEISRANLHDLSIVWKDGHQSIYPARYLRLRCPCAGCVDEWTGRQVLKSADVPEDVAPTSLQLVGRYALRVHWSDGHSHGIYTFEFLRDWSKGPSGLDLVRLWDKTSIQRRMLSHDYASWRGEGSTESALFGWEDGVQSLLQRLHEVYIELDGEGEELARLSELSLAIAEEQAEGWVVEGSAASPQDFQQTTRRLGEMLRAHVPLNKPY